MSNSATPWTLACQALQPMGFSRRESCSGLPCPPPGHLPDPGIGHASPALEENSLLLSHRKAWSTLGRCFLEPRQELHLEKECEVKTIWVWGPGSWGSFGGLRAGAGASAARLLSQPLGICSPEKDHRLLQEWLREGAGRQRKIYYRKTVNPQTTWTTSPRPLGHNIWCGLNF